MFADIRLTKLEYHENENENEETIRIRIDFFFSRFFTVITTWLIKNSQIYLKLILNKTENKCNFEFQISEK